MDEAQPGAEEEDDFNIKSPKKSCQKKLYFYHHSLYTCKIKNCVTCAENFIVNLSSHVLSVPEKLVLSKRLSFIPTAKDLTNFEILSDFNLFTHKLRKCINPPCTNPCTDGFPLYCHDNNMNTKPSLLSTYPQFEGALNSIKNQLSELPTHQSNTFNLSRLQRVALVNLCKNRDIIINPLLSNG